MRNIQIRTKRAQRRKNPLLCINESDLRLIAKLVRFSLTEGVNLFENQSEEKADISDIVAIIDSLPSPPSLPKLDVYKDFEQSLSKSQKQQFSDYKSLLEPFLGTILRFANKRLFSGPDNKASISVVRSIADLDKDQIDKLSFALDTSANIIKNPADKKAFLEKIRNAFEMVGAQIEENIRNQKHAEDLDKSTESGRKSKPTQDVSAAVKNLETLSDPQFKNKIVALFDKVQKLTHPKVKYYRADVEKKIASFMSDLNPDSDKKEISSKLDELDKTIENILKKQKVFEKEDPVKSSQTTHDPFAAEDKPAGFMTSLKKLFSKIRSENFDLDCDVITEEIINLMTVDDYLPTQRSTARARRIIKEMLEDHNKMGPSKTGVFDAPHEEHPGYMLLGNLKRLAAKANDLADLASPWDDAEPWIESKINSAAEHVDAVHDYIMYSVLGQEFNAAEHEDMMYECGEMSGDLMMEPMYNMDASGSDLIGGRNFGDGGSAQMARGQLFQIAKKSQSLSDRLTDDDTLPEWLQSKVAMAYQTISAISDYLDYKMVRQDLGDPVLETRKRRRSR